MRRKPDARMRTWLGWIVLGPLGERLTAVAYGRMECDAQDGERLARVEVREIMRRKRRKGAK